jgi:hypothetical protein
MMEMMLSMMAQYRCWASCLYSYLTSLEVVYGDRTDHTPALRLHFHEPIARDQTIMLLGLADFVGMLGASVERTRQKQ